MSIGAVFFVSMAIVVFAYVIIHFLVKGILQ